MPRHQSNGSRSWWARLRARLARRRDEFIWEPKRPQLRRQWGWEPQPGYDPQPPICGSGWDEPTQRIVAWRNPPYVRLPVDDNPRRGGWWRA